MILKNITYCGGNKMGYFYLLLNSTIIFIPFFNLLPYRLKNIQYTVLLIYLYGMMILFGSLGHTSAYLALGGAFILIFIFSSHKLMNTCCAIIGYLFNVILNHALLILLELILEISITDIYAKYLYVFSILYLILLFVITYILGGILRKKVKKQNISFSKKISIAIYIYFVFCVIIFIFNFSYAEKIGYPSRIILINGILFLFYFLLNVIVFIFSLQIQKRENDFKRQIDNRKQLNDYMETLEHVNKEMRSFKHDYLNILATIRGFLIEDDLDGLRSYYSTQLFLEKELYPLEIGKLSNIYILEVKGLIYTKIIKANANGIKVCIDIPYPFSHTTLDIIDLVRIMGILLDNAIEANENYTNSEINIIILQEENTFIQINNTCSHIPIPISSLGEPGITTKGNGRGYGLNNIKKVLQKYPTVRFYCNYKANHFTQTLENL